MRSPPPLFGAPLAFAWLVASAFAAMGCSSYSLRPVAQPPVPAFGPPRPDVATVCLFRPTSLGALLTVPVRDNGQLVGATSAHSYFCWHAEPGRHRISVAGGTDASDRTLTLAAGERVHLQHEINIGNDALRIASEAETAEYAGECEYNVVSEAPAEDGPLNPLRVARAQSQ